VRIERAAFEDLAEILALQKLAYQIEAALHETFDLPPLTQTQARIEADFKDQVFLKASSGGRIVGSVRARLAGGTCHIGRLIVHPDIQGRGLGTRLMREIERLFPEAERYELFTGHKSARNLALYQRLGYRPCREQVVSPKLRLIFLEKRSGAGGAGD